MRIDKFYGVLDFIRPEKYSSGRIKKNRVSIGENAVKSSKEVKKEMLSKLEEIK
jgi:ribosome-associated heat shock protein Hsp15